ncbi:MAG TPA: histidine kinase, partial [Rugosimonospora sp.]|nr:histidine kinase [Rugosimonospora sp.]
MLSQWRAAARRQPHADIAIAAVLYAVTLVTTATARAGEGLNPPRVLLAAVACGALAARRRWPFPVLVVSTLAAEFFLAPQQGHEGALVLAAPLLALYTVADATPRRKALLGGGLAVLALASTHIWLRPESWMGAENLALAALGGLAVAAGDASRSRRAYLAEMEERARRAEAERDREASRRVTEERLRIARDLHDVVGHHLALINVQAGVAAHVLDEQPAQVRQSLAHIRHASRSALDELRDTIGLLREPDEPAAPTEPTVGLAGLDQLVAAFRRSGLRVDRSVSGAARPLPPATDVTAYRVVQESLTNVCKHARRPAARLRLEYQAASLRIVVDDDGGPAGGAAGPGHGIVGMRERVAALGG